MSGKEFISPEYIPIYEAFLSIPLPDDPFSLLLPLEDDVKCDDSLELLDELDDMAELGEIVLDLIDVDIRDELVSFPPASFTEVENGYLSFLEDPYQNAATSSSSADDKQPLPIPRSVEAFSEPTKLPDWLVRPEVFNETTHYLCNVEVQDFGATRLKLLCMHVAEKETGGPNENIIKNSKKIVDSASKSFKQHKIPKVSHVTQLKAKEPRAMQKSGEEQVVKSAKEAGVALVNEKLWNHFHRLSKINVPVLESAVQCGTNVPIKSRRKQILLPQANAPESTAVKLQKASNDNGADNKEVLVEQPSNVSHETTSKESSGVMENGSRGKKIFHKFGSKQNNKSSILLDQKSRKLLNTRKALYSSNRERQN